MTENEAEYWKVQILKFVLANKIHEFTNVELDIWHKYKKNLSFFS